MLPTGVRGDDLEVLCHLIHMVPENFLFLSREPQTAPSVEPMSSQICSAPYESGKADVANLAGTRLQGPLLEPD